MENKSTYGYVAIVVIAAVMVGSYQLYDQIGDTVKKGKVMHGILCTMSKTWNQQTITVLIFAIF